VSAAPLTIKIGGYQPPASIHNIAARRFGEKLVETLGAPVDFESIPSVLDLGRPSGDLPVMVEKGELSLCYMSTVRFSRSVPELQMLELPFLVRDRATIWRALDGPLGDLFVRRMHATEPFRVLGLWDNGFRHLTNKVRPIRRPEDCRGLRIRTQGSARHGEVFKALGFEPMAIDIKRFVQEVAGDTVDAHDNPLTSIYVFGVHRHHRHITLTGHFFGASFLLCNASHYEGWPADVRAAVDEAARDATALQRRLAASEDQEVLAKLDPRENDVVHLTAAEHAAFVDAVRPVRARLQQGLDPALFDLLTRDAAPEPR
jgi:TRAP-type C4-dicarboxylate transport system substrate-binding protein